MFFYKNLSEFRYQNIRIFDLTGQFQKIYECEESCDCGPIIVLLWLCTFVVLIRWFCLGCNFSSGIKLSDLESTSLH